MIDFLVYVSQARAGLSDDDIAAILATSHEHNPSRAITGMLLFAENRDGRRGSFMQLLEGPAEAVEALRRRIFDDPRHHTKIVVERGSAEDRSFPDWSMAYKAAPDSGLAAGSVFSDLGEEAFFDRCRHGEVAGSVAFLCEFWNAEP